MLYALFSMLSFGSFGDEIPCSLFHLFDFTDKLGQILFSIDEIDLARIDNEKGGLVTTRRGVWS